MISEESEENLNSSFSTATSSTRVNFEISFATMKGYENFLVEAASEIEYSTIIQEQSTTKGFISYKDSLIVHVVFETYRKIEELQDFLSKLDSVKNFKIQDRIFYRITALDFNIESFLS